MEQAVHQTLINDIENLLAVKKGVDESQAKKFRRQAETLLEAQKDHAMTKSLTTSVEKLRTRVHQQTEKRDKDFEQVIKALTKATDALKTDALKTAEDATQKALSVAGAIPGLSAQRRAEIDKQLDRIYPKMRNDGCGVFSLSIGYARSCYTYRYDKLRRGFARTFFCKGRSSFS